MAGQGGLRPNETETFARPHAGCDSSIDSGAQGRPSVWLASSLRRSSMCQTPRRSPMLIASEGTLTAEPFCVPTPQLHPPTKKRTKWTCRSDEP